MCHGFVTSHVKASLNVWVEWNILLETQSWTTLDFVLGKCDSGKRNKVRLTSSLFYVLFQNETKS